MGRLIFSGHDSFTCKQFWLKKGFDFVKSEKKFADETAVIDLGVGKNMVSSIRYWGKAFGVIEDKDNASHLGDYLFGENGQDLFLEDIGSVWLLHYFLVKRERASIYNLVFNEFQNTREEFTKDQLHTFLQKKCDGNSRTTYNENTITKDIVVFLKSYLKPVKKRAEIEERFTGLLHELNLILTSNREDTEGQNVDWYRIRKDEKESIPYQVILFSILDNFEDKQSISFKDLQIAENSPGRVFGMNSEGLYSKIKLIEENYDGIVYSETAGNRTLQINTNLDKWAILNEYYN